VPTSSEPVVTSATVALPDDVDLHARPAADFVRTAMRFASRIWVAVDDREVDAKSLLSVMALGARRGTEVRLRAEGDDASAAIDALTGTLSALRE
jgi:phosphocarrier protein HPr